MANKEIISSLRGIIGKYNLTDEEWQTVEKTIKLLSNSDEDCISRAEALKNLALTNSKDDVYRMINSLPSVQPKPKTDVLDKIRAEIKEVQTYKMFEGEDTVYVERKDVLAIIEKYKAEKE